MLVRTISIMILGLTLICSPFASGDNNDANSSFDTRIGVDNRDGDACGVNSTESHFRPPGRHSRRVALMFVGHGEPTIVEDGDIPIVYPDGAPFGPHGVDLGVPEAYQHTEWAAAY